MSETKNLSHSTQESLHLTRARRSGVHSYHESNLRLRERGERSRSFVFDSIFWFDDFLFGMEPESRQLNRMVFENESFERGHWFHSIVWLVKWVETQFEIRFNGHESSDASWYWGKQQQQQTHILSIQSILNPINELWFFWK